MNGSLDSKSKQRPQKLRWLMGGLFILICFVACSPDREVVGQSMLKIYSSNSTTFVCSDVGLFKAGALRREGIELYHAHLILGVDDVLSPCGRKYVVFDESYVGNFAFSLYSEQLGRTNFGLGSIFYDTEATGVTIFEVDNSLEVTNILRHRIAHCSLSVCSNDVTRIRNFVEQAIQHRRKARGYVSGPDDSK